MLLLSLLLTSGQLASLCSLCIPLCLIRILHLSQGLHGLGCIPQILCC